MHREKRIHFFVLPILGLGVFLLLTFIRANATDTVTVYVTKAITDQRILPTTVLPAAEISDTVTVKASPGEYEPATFTVKANSAITDMTVTASNLTSGSNTISSSYVDVKAVKVWWQAGTELTPATKVLAPELLLNNDDLVTVDAADNYLTVTSTAIKISSAAGIGGWGTSPTTDAFPVQDAATLQSVDIANGTNKQFWITVQVPSGTTAGTYTGTITLASGGITLKTLTLNLTVYPITLAASDLEYSIFYQGYIRTTGTISSAAKNETQVRAELTDMKNHGINPTIYDIVASTSSLADILSIRQELGLSNGNIYFEEDSIIGQSSNTMVAYKSVATQYNVTNLYLSGASEADMTPYTSDMDAAHTAGVKIFNANTAAQATAVADRMDVAVVNSLDAATVAALHSYGNKAFSYGTPYVANEDPWIYRKSYGLSLWQYDYDGAMNWAYQMASSNIWDDFDAGYYRDLVFTYPTVNGVIGTIQYEGFREAIDDARYMATLQDQIDANTISGAKSVTGANTYLDYLKATSLDYLDLDSVRDTMVAYILYFLGQGVEPATVTVCGNNTREGAEECDGTALNSKTCTDFGYTGGTLTCRPISCYFDKSACTPAVAFSTAYDSTSDYASGYVNRSFANVKVSTTSTYDATAYADFVDSTSTLVAHWTFNESSGTTVADASGNGNDGSLAGGEFETADTGTTETAVQESTANSLANADDAYNGWTFLATSGAASGTSRTISDYAYISATDKDITLASALTGFVAGDTYHMYYDASSPTFATGKFGNAVQLDGIDDYVQLGDSTPALSEFTGSVLTISMWFNTSKVIGSQFLIGKNGPFYIYLYGTHLVGSVYFNNNGYAWQTITGGKTVTTNTWHLATLVYNAGLLSLYLDGVLDASKDYAYATDKNINYSDGCVQIGRYNSGGCYGGATHYFQGKVDDVMIFKRALSAKEVRSLYNASIFPLEYQTGTLTTGSSYLLSAFVTNTNGDYQQMATRTITAAPTSGEFDLSTKGFSGYPLKILSGSSWDQLVVTSSSTVRIMASSTQALSVGVNSSMLQITPSGGEAHLTLDSAYITADYLTAWTVSSSIAGTQVATTIKVPQQSVTSRTYYEIKVDGSHYADVSNVSGNASFTYNGGFSTRDFTIEAKSMPEGGSATSTIISDAVVNLIEFTPTSTIFTATTTPVSSSTATIFEVPQPIASTTPSQKATSSFEIIIYPVPQGLKSGAKPPVVSKPKLSSIPQANIIVTLQNDLKKLGFLSSKVPSAGYFDPPTKAALFTFQRWAGIYPVGIFGPQTMNILEQLLKTNSKPAR